MIFSLVYSYFVGDFIKLTTDYVEKLKGYDIILNQTQAVFHPFYKCYFDGYSRPLYFPSFQNANVQYTTLTMKVLFN